MAEPYGVSGNSFARAVCSGEGEKLEGFPAVLLIGAGGFGSNRIPGGVPDSKRKVEIRAPFFYAKECKCTNAQKNLAVKAARPTKKGQEKGQFHPYSPNGGCDFRAQ